MHATSLTSLILCGGNRRALLGSACATQKSFVREAGQCDGEQARPADDSADGDQSHRARGESRRGDRRRQGPAAQQALDLRVGEVGARAEASAETRADLATGTARDARWKPELAQRLKLSRNRARGYWNREFVCSRLRVVIEIAAKDAERASEQWRRPRLSLRGGPQRDPWAARLLPIRAGADRYNLELASRTQWRPGSASIS